MIPNPWVLLGFFGAFIGALLGGYFYGTHQEAKTWKLAIAKQEVEAAHLLADSENKARVIAEKYADLNIQIEKDHAEANAKIDDAHAANADLVRKLGLYVKSRRGEGGCNNLPGSAGASSGSSSDAAYFKLPDETSLALLALAADADRAAEYGRACHDWAMSLSR